MKTKNIFNRNFSETWSAFLFTACMILSTSGYTFKMIPPGDSLPTIEINTEDINYNALPLNTKLEAEKLPGNLEYHFQITAFIPNSDQQPYPFVIISTTNKLDISEIFTYGRTYRVQVKAVSATNSGDYGSGALLTVEPHPSTQLKTRNKGYGEVGFEENLYADPVFGADQYLFVVENVSLPYNQSIITTENHFRLIDLPVVPDNFTNYTIKVRTNVNGSTPLFFGSPTTITTEKLLVPIIIGGSGEPLELGYDDWLESSKIAGTQTYEFVISSEDGSLFQTLNLNTSKIRIRDINNLVYGELYQVRVRAISHNAITPYGPTTTFYYRPPCTNNTDKNWHQIIHFDEDAAVIGEMKSFSDGFGRMTQTQGLNVVEGFTLASEIRYDAYGRPTLSTMPAPTYNRCTTYDDRFLLNTNSNNFTVDDYATNAPNRDDLGAINNPKPVENLEKGTLGWYYSKNNDDEPYVAASAYPYAEVEYYNGTGRVKRISMAGEAHRFGSGHEQIAAQMPVLGELDHYLSLRPYYVSNTGNLKNTLTLNGVKSVSKDVNGLETVSYYDRSGKLLATGIATSAADAEGMAVTNTFDFSDQYQLVVKASDIVTTHQAAIDAASEWYSPACEGFFIQAFSANNATSLQSVLQYDNTSLVCTSRVQLVNKLNELFAQRFGEPNFGNFEFTILSDGVPVDLNYNIYEYECYLTGGIAPVSCGCGSPPSTFGQTGYNFNSIASGSFSSELLPYELENIQLHFSSPTTISNLDNGLYTLENIITENTAQYGVSSSIPNIAPGFYRLYKTDGTGLKSLAYTSYIKEVTYYYYDDAGNLVAIVPPKAVDFTSSGQPSMATLYDYNAAGELISQETVDAGETQYLYRNDGLLRFSQNAKQRPEGKFSYTDYDRRGRIIEVGEFAPIEQQFSGEAGTVTRYTVQFQKYQGILLTSSNSYYVGNYVNQNNLPEIYKTQRTYFKYDIPAGDVPTKANAASQQFTIGKLSKSWNEESATWYSYDELGRVTWTVQKTKYSLYQISYTYDFLGNVKTVRYEDLNDAEQHLEHHYYYDAAKRLVQVETVENGSNRKVQAKYEYYQHGPLKRVELAEELQGVDYFYTINGWLKGINNPSFESEDPGMDGIANGFAKDVFAQNIHYYNQDYESKNISWLTNAKLGGAGVENDLYNGVIRSTQWYNQQFDGVMDDSYNQYNAYVYAYDQKYQLKGATFGRMSITDNPDPEVPSAPHALYFTASSNKAYQLSNLDYDHNGNILNLRRNSDQNLMHFKGEDRAHSDGVAVSGNDARDKMVYNYINGTNQLASISSETVSPMSGTSQTATAVVYNYNEIGQVTEERAESPINPSDAKFMEYNVYGKVVAVWKQKAVGTDTYGNPVTYYSEPIVKYHYDERGFRIRKDLYDVTGGTFDYLQSEAYVRDVAGNIMTTYTGSDFNYELELYAGDGSTAFTNGGLTNNDGELLSSNFYLANRIAFSKEEDLLLTANPNVGLKVVDLVNELTFTPTGALCSAGTANFRAVGVDKGTGDIYMNFGNDIHKLSLDLSSCQSSYVFSNANLQNDESFVWDIEVVNEKIYLACIDNCIRVFDKNTFTFIVGYGEDYVFSSTNPSLVDGDGNVARFRNPRGIAVSQDGRYIYVADQSNNVIRKIDTQAGSLINGIPAGLVSTIAGTVEMSGGGFLQGKSGGTVGDEVGDGTNVHFFTPYDIELGNNDRYAYITDFTNDAIRRIDLKSATYTVRTLLVNNHNGVNIIEPRGLAINSKGDMYVSTATRVYRVSNTLIPIDAEYPLYGMGRIGVAYDNGADGTSTMDYTYELSDHLGNVRAVLSMGDVNKTTTSLYNFDDGTVQGWSTSNPYVTLSNIQYELDVQMTGGGASITANDVGSPVIQLNQSQLYRLSFDYTLMTGKVRVDVDINGTVVASQTLDPSASGANLYFTTPEGTGTSGVKIFFRSFTDVSMKLDNIRIDEYERSYNIEQASDYYPFGMVMGGRNYVSSIAKNRFGYQGQFSEKDEETGWNSFELRNYDSEIGRWLIKDPLKQFNSPYLGMANNPINASDPDGAWVFLLNLEGRVLVPTEGVSVTGSLNLSLAVDDKGNYSILWTPTLGGGLGAGGSAGFSGTLFTHAENVSEVSGLALSGGGFGEIPYLPDLGGGEINVSVDLNGLVHDYFNLPEGSIKPYEYFRIGGTYSPDFWGIGEGGGGYVDIGYAFELYESKNFSDFAAELAGYIGAENTRAVLSQFVSNSVRLLLIADDAVVLPKFR